MRLAWQRLELPHAYIRSYAMHLPDLYDLIGHIGCQAGKVARLDEPIQLRAHLGSEVIVKVRPQLRRFNVWIHAGKRGRHDMPPGNQDAWQSDHRMRKFT